MMGHATRNYGQPDRKGKCGLKLGLHPTSIMFCTPPRASRHTPRLSRVSHASQYGTFSHLFLTGREYGQRRSPLFFKIPLNTVLRCGGPRLRVPFPVLDAPDSPTPNHDHSIVRVCNSSVTTSVSLYTHATKRSLVVLPKSILGIMSIISSHTRAVSGRFVTEVTILPGPVEIKVD